MAHPSQVRVLLDLELGSEPISGSIVVLDHAPKQFFGWLELAGELESARAAARADPLGELLERPS